MRQNPRFAQILKAFEAQYDILFHSDNHFATFRSKHNFFSPVSDPFFLLDEIWKELLVKLQEKPLRAEPTDPTSY